VSSDRVVCVLRSDSRGFPYLSLVGRSPPRNVALYLSHVHVLVTSIYVRKHAYMYSIPVPLSAKSDHVLTLAFADRKLLSCIYCESWPDDGRVVVAVFGVANCGHWHFPYLGKLSKPVSQGPFLPACLLYPYAWSFVGMCLSDCRVVVAVFGVANCGHRHFPYRGNWLSLSQRVYTFPHIDSILIHGLLLACVCLTVAS